jgi:hypothetical protein
LQGLSNGIEEWLNYSIHDKLIQFAGMLQNMRRDLRLGGIIGIYRLLKSEQGTYVSEDIVNTILEEIFVTLYDYAAQEFTYLASALELIGFLGPNLVSFEKLQIIKQMMCEPGLNSL